MFKRIVHSCLLFDEKQIYNMRSTFTILYAAVQFSNSLNPTINNHKTIKIIFN